MLVINRIGLSAGIVDNGRRNVQARGFSQSGALDWINYQLANALCGMPLYSPCIEILGGDFACSFEANAIVTISGAQLDVFINEQKVRLNSPHKINKGDSLVLSNLTSGFTSYIALNGTFDCPLFGGSVCAVKREKIGGLHQNGKLLGIGDVLKFDTNSRSYLQYDDKLAKLIPPILQNYIHASLCDKRVLFVNPAYQSERFSGKDVAMFYASEFEVSANFDRMGVRLTSPSNIRKYSSSFSSLRSQAIALGSIQVPENGQAIILRNDRQTIGGYPIIGIVDSVSLSMLGQAKENDEVCFQSCDVQESETKRLLISLALKKVLNANRN